MSFKTNDTISLKVESYQEMFERVGKKDEGAFVPFVVAGDPDMETSLEIVKTLVDNGADALEIGFAFSDPIADGPTVQGADLRALNSDMTTDKAFEFVKKIREFTSIPIGLLVYYNLIYQRGVEQFYKEAHLNGVNAILSADLPPEEAEDAISAAKNNNIDQIFLVAQTTTIGRLEKISQVSSGFIYLVSVMGVTGARKEIKTSTVDLIKRIRKHNKLPIMVGFGISQPVHVKEVISAGAEGAIVGSAIIDIVAKNLSNKDEMLQKVAQYTKELKKATKL
ncbi:tryptophan synthase subunit alpha [Methanobacterium alcaliphilum]|uniref:tryptophan synthase subunit alpha n=1 Tax=Methanobacterium alcaliphilum TaxID=392018 RepID=UPI00200B8912|nr:tryptophan synthase subunit alpha [Methanobacterium alcaliphilum]MCK9152624.1 tryptophan synthase subunit alpha [Methanobacterium alcaliphilum]